jgi:transposase-like protein
MDQEMTSNKMCEGLPGTDAGNTGHVYELATGMCTKWFGSQDKYARVGTIGEGSCFFHSLSYALNRNGYVSLKTDEERKRHVHGWRCETFGKSFTEEAYTRFKTDKYKKSFKTCKTNMCNPTAWADEMSIRHAAEVLNVNIIFMDMRKKEAYCGMHSDVVLYKPQTTGVPTIIVAWVNNQHFEPIVRIEDVDTGHLHTMFHASHAKDKAMIEHLMKTYKVSCNL